MPVVKLFGNLRRAANASNVVATGDTVRAVLQSLCADNTALAAAIFDGAQLRAHLRVLVNGHDIELAQGLETRVQAQDQIAIFPPIAGGGWSVVSVQ
jgi:molybdopterin synthase sulfur carrier subunit